MSWQDLMAATTAKQGSDDLDTSDTAVADASADASADAAADADADDAYEPDVDDAGYDDGDSFSDVDDAAEAATERRTRKASKEDAPADLKEATAARRRRAEDRATTRDEASKASASAKKDAGQRKDDPVGDERPRYRVGFESDEEIHPNHRDWKYVGKVGDATIQYRDDESLLQGAIAKEEAIQRLKAEREEAVRAVQAERDQLQNKLSFYERSLPEEKLKALLIEQHLPEEFRGISKDDIIDLDERDRFVLELDRATKAAESQIEQAATETTSSTDNVLSKLAEVAPDVEKLLAPDALLADLGGSEAEEALTEVFQALTVANEEGEGDQVNPVWAAQAIMAMFGPEFARVFRDGLRAQIIEKHAGKLAAVRTVRRKREHRGGGGQPKGGPKPTTEAKYSGMSSKELMASAAEEAHRARHGGR